MRQSVKEPRSIGLRFQRARDQCCMLCNWPALADLESEGVRVDLESEHPRDTPKHRSICFPCIDALAETKAARRGRVVRVELDPELVGFLEFVRSSGWP